MRLLYAEVIEIAEENGLKMGRVRVGRACQRVPLELLATVRPGDTILVCDGVAISRVEEEADVSRDSRPAD